MALKPGDTLSHYEILEKLGEGGMGVVYSALDTRLRRKVAIKVLPDTATNNPARLGRFYREARAGSQVSHPNIVHIYEVGQWEGMHYLVMEYVEGVTLRKLLQDGPLEVSRCLKIGEQVADALQQAHTAGITHRDIKPENVMVTESGHAKVLDFGLAALVEPEEPPYDKSSTATQYTYPGQVMGTVGYMSPEQVLGRTVDGRSDLFSFGVMLYEMLAGRRPFEAPTRGEVMNRLVNSEPEAIARFNYEVPPPLEQIIRKCLEKDPEWRYQSARELVIDLASLQRSSISGAHPSAQLVAVRPRRRFSRKLVVWALTGLIGALLAIAYFALRPRPIERIAVLPFRSDSADADMEYLTDGIGDALIHDLSRMPNLKVTARSVVQRYRGRSVDPQQTGRDLNVQAVLSGTVSVQEDALSVHVELVDVNTGMQIWGQRYNRKLSDLASVQEAISQDIFDTLQLRLSEGVRRRLARQYAADPEAYRLHLKGRHHVNKRTVEDFDRAIHFFEQAIRKDPGYAPAYAGLADSYSLIANYGLQPPAKVLEKAKTAATRALEIDNSLGEAYSSLALARTLTEFDWQGAERDYQRSIDLNPNYASAHVWYALCLLSPQGRTEEALIQIRQADRIEPDSPVASMGQAVILYYARRHRESIAKLEELSSRMGAFPMALPYLAHNYVALSDYSKAEEVLQLPTSEQDDYHWRLPLRAVVEAGRGNTATAAALVRRVEERAKVTYVRPYVRVWGYLALGDQSGALSRLEEAFELRDPACLFLKVDPVLDPLRQNRRFAELLQRIKLQ